MTIKQGNVKALIASVDSGTVITITQAQTFVNGACTIYTPIPCRVQWAAETAEAPGIIKQITDVAFFFRDIRFSTLTFGSASNFSQSEELLEIEAAGAGSWGEGSWGDGTWGGDDGGDGAIRTYIPLEKSKCLWLKMSLATEEAFSSFGLTGYSISLRPIREIY